MLKAEVSRKGDNVHVDLELSCVGLSDVMSDLSTLTEAVDEKMKEIGLQKDFRAMFACGFVKGLFLKDVKPEEMRKLIDVAIEHVDKEEANKSNAVNPIVTILEDIIDGLRTRRDELQKDVDRMKAEKEDADKAIDEALKEAHKSVEQKPAEGKDATE